MSAHTVWEKEFEELFKKNYSKLFYYALDWVEDSEVAKDIVSELFGDTWRRYERLRNERIEAYLYRSVHNLCINYLRDKQVEMKYQQEVIEKRMGQFVDKVSHWKEFDYVLINEDLEDTIRKVQRIISGERMKRVRQPGLQEFVESLVKEAKNA